MEKEEEEEWGDEHQTMTNYAISPGWQTRPPGRRGEEGGEQPKSEKTPFPPLSV